MRDRLALTGRRNSVQAFCLAKRGDCRFFHAGKLLGLLNFTRKLLGHLNLFFVPQGSNCFGAALNNNVGF